MNGIILIQTASRCTDSVSAVAPARKLAILPVKCTSASLTHNGWCSARLLQADKSEYLAKQEMPSTGTISQYHE